jgi:hypothetical protein
MRLRLLSVLLLAGAATVVPKGVVFASPRINPSSGSGSIGIRLVPAAGASPSDSLAGTYVVARSAPGTSITRNLEIDNDTTASADVSVYPAAASIVRGSFAFAPDHDGNELSSWTSVTRSMLHLAADSQSLDKVTIKVPSTASAGQRYAVIWAEMSAAAPTAGGVELVNRVGIRMYLSIGSGGTPPSNFTIERLSAGRSATGEPLVVATVRNTGQSTLEIVGSLTLSKGPGGLSTGPFAVNTSTVLAPGISELATVQLNRELPRGPWRADLALTSGLIHRSTVVTITFPSDLGAARPPIKAGLPTLVPVVSALLVLLAITALALLVYRRRLLRLRVL